MDNHKATIDKILEIHAAVNPEVQVTVEQLCKEFPIFVRGLAAMIVEVGELSSQLGHLSNQINILVPVINLKLIETWKRTADIREFLDMPSDSQEALK